MQDDLGREYSGSAPRRVVSLVPSITEAVALAAPELLVGATDYCTHPVDLSVPRVGGSKYPDVASVLECEPDLVLANAEENKREDVEALEAAGTAVWVCYPTDVPSALESAARMFRHALRLPEPDWIDRARQVWATPAPVTRRAVIPIWRRPWMVLGADTFAGDVLRRLGVSNVFASADQPYPKVTVEQVREAEPDLMVLPDEPYAFSAQDGPESFAPIPSSLVTGRYLTWHGPSLADAREVLERELHVTVPPS